MTAGAERPTARDAREPRQDPIERLLDVAVFAPLGLALSAGDWVTKLAERGRRQHESRFPAARMIGEMAVREGRRRAERALEPLRRQAEETLAEWTRPASHRLDGEEEDGRRIADPSHKGDDDAPTPRPHARTGNPSGGVILPLASQLAIPGYDTLAASQVVQRLDGLSPEELEAVRAYEQGGRARKTVLTRVSQLRPAR